VTIRLPDILAEELREIVLGVRVSAQPAPGTRPVLRIDGTYREVDGDSGRTRDERFELNASVERVPAGEEQLAPTRDVDQAVATAQLVRVQIHAEEAATRGDFAAAQALLTVAHQSLESRGHGVVAEACARVMESLQDRGAFAASAPFRASLRKGMSRGAAAGLYDADAADFARRNGKGAVTLEQAALERSFNRKGGDGGQPTAGGRPTPAGGRPTTTAPSSAPPSASRSLNRRRSRRW
jgi:hypothetical protein